MRGFPVSSNVVLTDPTLATLTKVNYYHASGSPLLTKLLLNANAGDQILIFQEMNNTTKDRGSAGSGGLCVTIEFLA